MSVKWPDDIVEFIRASAAEKKSAREIEAELGLKGYVSTRNAVIGLCHRRGIKLCSNDRARKPRAVDGGKRPRSRAVVSTSTTETIVTLPAKPPVMKFPEFEFASKQPVSMAELKEGICRWPLGGFAARPPYLYCGAPALAGCYCLQHRQISNKCKGTTRHAAAIGAG
jgi:hypothetical protein